MEIIEAHCSFCPLLRLWSVTYLNPVGKEDIAFSLVELNECPFL